MGKLRQWFSNGLIDSEKSMQKANKLFMQHKRGQMTQYNDKVELQKQILKAEEYKIHQKIFVHIV